MEYVIRQMQPSEYPLLREFLYEAIYQQDETNPIPKSVIEKPELRLYFEDFGKYQDDHCLCAQVQGNLIGAVWVRRIKGYGSVDDTTIELAISLYKPYRGRGIGTQMMKEMALFLKNAGFDKVSLAVEKDNYAVKMYLKLGFGIVYENEQDYIMILNLQ